MKKMFSVNEVVKYEKVRMAKEVIDGNWFEEDVNNFINEIEESLQKFWDCNQIISLNVFEQGEFEDEQYGLMRCENVNEEVIVYLSGRGGVVVFTK